MAFTACAQTKKGKTNKVVKKNKITVVKPILLQATSQTTYPGREESPIIKEERFVLVWKDKAEPVAFFWHGDQSWQACNINKVKNFRALVVKDNGIPSPLNYVSTDPGNVAYKTGDTLELYPITGGKHPMPAEIPKDKKNIIYYKTANSAWLALPVEKITKLPTIAMP